MKKRYLLLMGLIGLLTMSCLPSISEEMLAEPTESIYSIKINSLDGNNLNLNDFKGKKILFVNVASKCGFTPQYEELQKLYEKYMDQLVIIGVPCNQFGMQEPGSSSEIAEFCSKNYGVTFPITEKVKVKGSEQHALYSWLTQKSKNGVTDSSVKWNFQKYLVSEEGHLIGVYSSKVKPFDPQIIEAITK